MVGSRPMAAPIEQQVWDALRTVKFPGMSRDIVSFGFVDKLAVDEGRVDVLLAIVTQNAEAARQVREHTEALIAAIPGVASAHVELRLSLPPARGESAQQAI